MMRDETVPPVVAYLALGSNLGDPAAQLASAARSIERIPHTSLLKRSSLYRSPAWGASDPQPDYVNAVVAVATTLTPIELWQATCRIEQAQGRSRSSERNAARTLDIDLLLYGDLILQSEQLTLPHPRMHDRAFVLIPLLEIAPDAVIPQQGSAASKLQQLSDQTVTRWSGKTEWN